MFKNRDKKRERVMGNSMKVSTYVKYEKQKQKKKHNDLIEFKP